MSLQFERGNSNEPKGHALLYFHPADHPEKPLATYVVVLPIPMDMAKYIPPLLAAQMAHISAQEFSVFAVPPVPEEVADLASLQRLAELRDEDLLYGGTLSLDDVTRAIQQVNDVIQSYAQLYSSYSAQAPASSTPDSTVAVQEVLYQLMSERDRLAELSKLIGTLRFAAERDDHSLQEEATAQIGTLARYLPQRYRIDDLLQAAQDPSQRSAELCRLYIDRCYRLFDEDYATLKSLDEAIQRLESPTGE